MIPAWKSPFDEQPGEPARPAGASSGAAADWRDGRCMHDGALPHPPGWTARLLVLAVGCAMVLAWGALADLTFKAYAAADRKITASGKAQTFLQDDLKSQAAKAFARAAGA